MAQKTLPFESADNPENAAILTSKVTVLAGRARCGKTDVLLDRYRQCLAESGGSLAGRTLWIAPTSRAAAEVRSRLLSQDLTGCFDPGIVTFEQFTERVVQASGGTFRFLDFARQRQLLAALVKRATARDDLPYFASIAETEGLVELIAQWLAEVKRLEIWPEDFEKACNRRGLQKKDGDLLKLYQAYQDLLNHGDLYDREGRIWKARSLLAKGQQRPLGNLSLVVIDGFTDFTRTQHEIIDELVRRSEHVIISLPLEKNSQRAELFNKPRQTLHHFQERHSVNIQEVARNETEPKAPWPVLAHLERELFKNPREAKPSEHSEGIELLAAGDQYAEVEVVGRKIKTLLNDQRARPHEIVVVYRSLSEGAPLVREVFDELGIPYAIEAGRTLQDSPVLRAMLDLLQLARDDWPYRKLLHVIGSSYFRPGANSKTEIAAHAAAEQIIRRLQIPKGRKPLIEAVRRWAERARTASENDDVPQMARLAGLAEPVFAKLADALDKLPKRAALPEWRDALLQLAEQLGLTTVLESKASSAEVLDEAAWELWQSALIAGDEIAGAFGDPSPTLDLRELVERFRDMLRWVPLAERFDETGCVRVLSAPSARAISIPILFFAGLSEHAFPSPGSGDRLYSDGEKRELIEAGLPMIDGARRMQDEMLLFYEVITRPGRQLYLSYAGLDQKAEPVAPSPFLQEVLRLIGIEGVAHIPAASLSPIPQSAEPQSESDLRVMSVARALDGESELLASMVRERPQTTASIRAALEVVDERKNIERFGRYEGVLVSPAAQQWLESHFGPDHLWSASRLEQFASCPYQFYLERVLRLEPLGDLELEADPLTHGRLTHDVLSAVHRRLNKQFEGPHTPAGLEPDEFAALFCEVLEQVVAATPQSSAMDAACREIDRRQIARRAEEYYRQHKDYDSEWDDLDEPMRPELFEVRFGPPRTRRDQQEQEDEDSASIDAPFELEIEGERIKLTGRIDRIDIGQIGGQTVFNVLDYKTGKSASLRREDMKTGVSLQLPLYAMAAQQLLMADRNAFAWHASYWKIAERGYMNRRPLVIHGPTESEIALDQEWEELWQQITATVARLVRDIRQGQFVVYSRDEQCTGRCPYSTVCRVQQVRALGKLPPYVEEGQA